MTPDIIVILSLVASVVMFWFAPTLSRPGVYFGVTVAPDFRDTDVARASLRGYRIAVAGAGIAAMAIMSMAPSPRAKAITLLLHTAVAIAAWSLTRQSLMPHAQHGAAVRSASVTPRDTSVPGGLLALTGPFLIVAAAALFVFVQWEAIPEQFQSMQRGSAGRLTTKSIRTVFFPFAFTTALLVAFTIQTVFLLTRTRQISAAGSAADAEVRFKRRSAMQSLAATYLMAIGPSWFATHRLLEGNGRNLGSGLWVGTIMVFAVGVTIWAVRVGQGGQRQIPASATTPAGDATPDSAWRGGLVYFNPSDPAVFVEVRMGVGWTLNFANAWSWIFLVFAVAMPILVVRLMR